MFDCETPGAGWMPAPALTDWLLLFLLHSFRLSFARFEDTAERVFGAAGLADVNDLFLARFTVAFEDDLVTATRAEMLGDGDFTGLPWFILFDYTRDVDGLAFWASHNDLISRLERSDVLGGFDRLEFHEFAGSAFRGPGIGCNSRDGESDYRCEAADSRDHCG
jgi:hypothetical protein